MVLIRNTASYIDQLVQTHSRRQASKDSTPLPLFRSNNFVDVDNFKDFCWPTLLESNDEIDPYPWRNEDERHQVLSNDPPFSPPVMYNGPPLSPPAPPTLPLSPPTITDLAPKIIASADKLFFIAYKIGASACQEWHLV